MSFHIKPTPLFRIISSLSPRQHQTVFFEPRKTSDRSWGSFLRSCLIVIEFFSLYLLRRRLQCVPVYWFIQTAPARAFFSRSNWTHAVSIQNYYLKLALTKLQFWSCPFFVLYPGCSFFSLATLLRLVFLLTVTATAGRSKQINKRKLLSWCLWIMKVSSIIHMCSFRSKHYKNKHWL